MRQVQTALKNAKIKTDINSSPSSPSDQYLKNLFKSKTTYPIDYTKERYKLIESRILKRGGANILQTSNSRPTVYQELEHKNRESSA